MSETFPSDVLEDTAGLLSIGDWLRWTWSRFNEHELFFGHGSDNSRDEACHLVLQALELPWNLDPVFYSSRVTSVEARRLATLVRRRIEHRVPVSYLLNKAWFCGFCFYVDERVLIPRSPIAELIDDQFYPWLEQTPARVLDLCAGSGCIGLACAMTWPQAQVDLLDISPSALDVARINMDRMMLWDRVRALQSDLLAALYEEEERPRYQLLVSNPPYVDAEDMDDLPEEYQKEPQLGLAGGSDGLDMVRPILSQARDFLTDDGILVLEVGNSRFALEEAFPDVPFVWPEFKRGGQGVCVLSARVLDEYRLSFSRTSDRAG
ncbi:MAG: 50S ribosomal protein L3 N(5)-glutamine methyltransferase [Kistimonas sp.]|nr:50S ribosomal protein L3 N(5)-glutamine methyltransferase [Kistimonas sp.]